MSLHSFQQIKLFGIQGSWILDQGRKTKDQMNHQASEQGQEKFHCSFAFLRARKRSFAAARAS